MSSSEDRDTEKPFDPTPQRIEEARKKGDVPKSTDLMTAGAYGGFLLCALVFGAVSVEQAGLALTVLLDRPDTLSRVILSDGGFVTAGGLMGEIALGIAPWFAIPATLVLATVIAQRAFTVTATKIQPKLSRVSPLEQIKNRLGRNGLFEFSKSFVKLLVYSIALGIFLKVQMPNILQGIHLGHRGAVALLAQQSLRFFVAVLAISLAIGAVDFLWQRAEFTRRNRMSRKEIQDETKNTEGDPHLKNERRQRGYDIATNRMLTDVPTADVIVVNPQHYAVALKWHRQKGSAPICVAKGVDEVAAKIREVAQVSGVPIHRDPPTARALHATTRVGDEIERNHYEAVASAIRFADAMRAKQGRTK